MHRKMGIKKETPSPATGGKKGRNPMWLASATSDRCSVTRVSVSDLLPNKSVECVLPFVRSRLNAFHPDRAVRFGQDLTKQCPLRSASSVSPHADADDAYGARDDVAVCVDVHGDIQLAVAEVLDDFTFGSVHRSCAPFQSLNTAAGTSGSLPLL